MANKKISKKEAEEIKKAFEYDFFGKTWSGISRYQKLSEAFIEKYSDRVNWDYISAYQKLSENFIEEHVDEVDWHYISKCQKLSEEFIEKYSDRVIWDYMSSYQKLSEEFIEEHSDEVDWDCISKYQKLSEKFIEKYSDEVDWDCISKYQKLSENFIEEHVDEVNWYYVSKCQIITPEFAKKHNIQINNNSQRSASEWKQMIEKTNMYECHKDYFYAYKGIRNDRYSQFNFQYQYLPGETYECFSDYSDNENSFGLSAWTEEAAMGYCSELVVKVKIYYSDVTAIVHDSNKIRCKKITILN